MTKKRKIKILKDLLIQLSDIANLLCTREADERCEVIEEYIKVLEQQPSEDVMAIHTQGLDEGIRCAMCTNSMKSDTGCDGGCRVDEDMYKKVMDTIRNHIVPPVTPTFPKGATNGDMIKTMFPNIEANEVKTDTGGYIEVKYLDTTDKCDATAFRKNWWDTPYKL